MASPSAPLRVNSATRVKGAGRDFQGSKSHRRSRLLRRLLPAFLIVMLGVAPALAGRKKHKAPPSSPADLPDQVLHWARQLYGVPLDESESLTTNIQNLVLNHLQKWLANNGPASGPAHEPLDAKVREQLEYAFSKLHTPLIGQPAVFAEPWRSDEVIGAGYTLGWTDYNRANVIAIFETHGNQASLITVTHFVPHTDLHYDFLPPLSNGDLRFFVYGTRLGKSQLRLTAILYWFDGKALKPLWQVKDAYDGKLEVTPEKVTLRYLKEDEYIRAVEEGGKPLRYEAVYSVTPQGLQLVTIRPIPF